MTPASGRVLLDTNIVIDFLAGDHRVVTQARMASGFFIPVTVVGELVFGAAKSSRPAENLHGIEALAKAYPVVTCDGEAAWHYGQVKEQLRKRGRPIPDNDIWIAAMALRHDMPLVTRDHHFGEVIGLRVIDWSALSLP